MGQLAEYVINHPIYVAGLVAAVVAVLVYELRLRSQGIAQLSVADAVRLINKGAIVVDVRSADAYRSGHIANARNVVPGDLEADGQAVKKLKGKLVVTVCDNGVSSARAAKLLRNAGHEQVFSLRGGLSGWRSQNMPLVK